jgi:hypothetical protein
MIGSISLGVIAGVGVIIASVGMSWWATTSRTALPSKRVAVVGVSVLALLIGVILVARVTSGPAYEATAEIVIESAVSTFHNLPEDPALAEEVSIFGSPRVAGDAVSLAADLDSGAFAWYSPVPGEPSPTFDSWVLLNSYHVETSPGGRIAIRFRAEQPEEAQVGANLVVEAYLRFRPQVHFSLGCPPGNWPGQCPPLDPIVASASFAPVPTNRINRPDLADVGLFVLSSMLAVLLTWRWWPDPSRSPRLEDWFGTREA